MNEENGAKNLLGFGPGPVAEKTLMATIDI